MGLHQVRGQKRHCSSAGTKDYRSVFHCTNRHQVLSPKLKELHMSNLPGMLMLPLLLGSRESQCHQTRWLSSCPGNSSYCPTAPPFLILSSSTQRVPWPIGSDWPTASCSTSFAVSGPSCGGSSPLPWAGCQPKKMPHFKHVLCRKG